MSWRRRLGTQRAGQHTGLPQIVTTTRRRLPPPPLLLRCSFKIFFNKASLTSFFNLLVFLKMVLDLPTFWAMMRPHWDYGVPEGNIGRGRAKTPCLSPQAKRLIFRIIHHLFERLEKACFVTLEAEDILVDPKTEEPSLRATVKEAPVRTQDGVNSNLNQLGCIIENLIRTKELPAHLRFDDFKIPREVLHLLDLLQLNNPMRMKLVIKYHSALVPMGLRGCLYLLVHQWFMDFVRVFDYLAFDDVLVGIDRPEGNWIINVQNGNRYLYDFYQRGRDLGSYDVGRFESTPILHPLDFSRNLHSHPFEGCVLRWGKGPRFTKKDMNLALYFIFDTQLASLMVALHARGYLSDLEKELAEFFPYLSISLGQT